MKNYKGSKPFMGEPDNAPRPEKIYTKEELDAAEKIKQDILSKLNGAWSTNIRETKAEDDRGIEGLGGAKAERLPDNKNLTNVRIKFGQPKGPDRITDP